jgi:hypothetical protein
MTREERIVTLEHRVRELQTAVATLVRYLRVEHEVGAAERAHLDEIRMGVDDVPSRHLSELYDRHFQAP